VLSEEVIADGQIINVILASLSLESTLEAVLNKRDKRPAEIE
jgi:hypothetical protein